MNIRTTASWLALIAAVTTTGLRAQEPTAAALAALEAAEARFAAAQDGSYRYGYHKNCECYAGTPPLTVVTVTDGSVERVHHVHEDDPREVPAREGSEDLYWTVPELFGKLEGAYERGAVVRVSFHESDGYPTSLYIDYDAALIGEETDLELVLFEPL